VLVAGAHPDDAEIGAGGSIARITAERPDARFAWLVAAAPDPGRAREARASADALVGAATAGNLVIGDLRDGYLPFLGGATKELVATLQPFEPDLVIGPRRDDAHQDHRTLAELLPQVFRDSTILEYEIPKSDGDLGAANLYVQLTEAEGEAKIAHLLKAFPSQVGRSWFTADTFRAILHLRGLESRAPERRAEAFVCRKLIF
jgi:LmbE family N-acetylglucosaminyl deacetylase